MSLHLHLLLLRASVPRILICLLAIIACFLLASTLSAESKIAILGDLDKNRAEIDVLTEKLSKQTGVVLVERSEIEKVLREQEISAFGASSAGDAIKTGQLLGARGVIIIKGFEFEGKSILSARLVAVESGAIISVWVDDSNMHNDSISWGTTAAQAIVPSLGKLTVSKADAIPVSILNIRSSWNNEAGLRFANKVRLLMELRLMMQKEVFVLERWRLGALQWEKDLQGSTEQFWTGAYIIEGLLENVSEEKDLVEIAVYLSLPGQEKPEIIRQRGKLSDPVALVNAISDELVIKMGKRPADGKLETWKVEIESNAYANEAFWAYRASQHEKSRAAADAAMALGNDNPNLKFVNVKSHLAEFAEKNSFSLDNTTFLAHNNVKIPDNLLTQEKINILINGVQACKEFAMSTPDNATKFWGPYNDWRILCAETISCAGSVLKRIENDKNFVREAEVLRKLCRDFAHCIAVKGKDSDLIYPFLATYLNGLPCFSEDPDMMLEEFKWLLSLDFPALPNMRLEIRESHLYSLDDWFKQAEKDRTSKDYSERIKKSKEKRDEWCEQMIDSANLSDNISGFIVRQAPSDIPKLLELYEKNFVRIATGGDSYDCVACVPKLISAIPSNPRSEVLLGENLSVETFCEAFLVEDLTTVDLHFLLKHLYYQYVKNISAENYREISQSWWDFKKRLMKKNPTHYLINLPPVAEIDKQIEIIRKKTSEDSATPFCWEKTHAELVLKERIGLPIKPEDFNPVPSQKTSARFNLKKMSYENGKLLAWGGIDNSHQKLPILYSITPKTWELLEYLPPSEIFGMAIGSDGIFITSEKILYYVDENGIILKNDWGENWEFVADAKLKNPTAGCHTGGSLFVAFGKDTNNLYRTGETGWRSDIIEIPDGSSEIKIFTSNTRRPKIAKFDDCRPYETMTMFGSPDGTTLFFAPYMRPCYKLFYCDLKNPLEWKTSLHQHNGSESRMYDNPYDGGIYFSCVCGHTGYDLNFSKGLEATEIFEFLRATIELESKPKKSLKWSNNLGNQLYSSNGRDARGGAFNGKNLVLYMCNYQSAENFLLCFKDGTPGPFKILLQQNDKIGRENLLTEVSLASSEEFLFIFALSYVGGGSTQRVWLLKWEDILAKMKDIASVPGIKITPSIFADSAQVTMAAAEGEKILYSINEDLYENNAKVYSEPFEIKESSRIIACSVKSDGGIPSLPEIRDCLKMPLLDPVELKNPSPGLRYTCWKGTWEKFPVFEKISPFKTGVTAKIDINALGMEKFFALKFSSFIKIPADGLYRFNIDAPGRVMMKFHGAEMHRRPSAWTRTLAEFSVGLKAGYHPVDIYFMQDEFDSELKIEWEGAGIARQVLPENIFLMGQ